MTIVFMMNAHRRAYKQLIEWLRTEWTMEIDAYPRFLTRAIELKKITTLGERHKEESRALFNKIKEDVIVADRDIRCWVIVGSGSNSQRIIGLERHEERLHVIKLVIIKKIKIKRTRNQLKVGQVEEVWKIRV